MSEPRRGCEERLRALGLFSPWKRSSRGQSCIVGYLVQDSKDGAGLFLKVNRERQETMETSSKTGNFSCTRTKSAELGTEAERGSESSILGRVQKSSG